MSVSVGVRIWRIGFARQRELPSVFCEDMGQCFSFPIYRFILPCVASFQMVMSIRFLGFMVVIKHVLEQMQQCSVIVLEQSLPSLHSN